MDVFGQLKKAQLENTTTNPTKRGEIIFNTSDSKVKYSDGSNSRTVVNTDEAQTLTNKTIVAEDNTITTKAVGNLGSTELNDALAELQSDIDTRATSSELSSHASNKNTHGVTGDIVGTTDTQTLSNKTLANPVVDDVLSLKNRSTIPATPSAGSKKLYSRNGGLYFLDESGVETEVVGPQDTANKMRVLHNISLREFEENAHGSVDWECVSFSESYGLFTMIDADRWAISYDGKTWNNGAGIISGANQAIWKQLIWSEDKNLFIACGQNLASGSSGCFMTSANGDSWTVRNAPLDYPGLGDLESIAYAPELGLFISSGWDDIEKVIMTSTDGLSWTKNVSTRKFGPNKLIWCNGFSKFVGIDDSGNIVESDDGLNWTVRVAVSGERHWTAIAYSPEYNRVIVTDAMYGYIRYSTNGTSWTEVGPNGFAKLGKIIWSSDLLCFIGIEFYTKLIYTSETGLNYWTYRTSVAVNDICWGSRASLCVGVGNSKTIRSR